MASRDDVWLKRARSKDSARPVMQQIHNNGTYAISTDGFRLHLVLGSDEGERVDGFPDVASRVLDVIKQGKQITVSRLHLMRAVKAAKAWRNSAKAARFSFNGALVVEGKSDDGHGTCEIRNGEAWEGVGDAVYQYDGEDVEQIYNHDFILQALQGMPNDDTVLLLLTPDMLGIVAGDRIAAIMRMSGREL